MTVAFVFANGRSRIPYDVEKLRQHGTIIGCNNAYLDLDPDILVSVDKPMIDIIIDSKYSKDFYIPKHIHDQFYFQDRDIKYYDHRCPGIVDSGNFALMIASITNHDMIYMLGFDYISQNRFTNNVYAGCHNYKQKHQMHILPESEMNWYNKLAIVLARHHAKFIRVNTNDYVPPTSWHNFTNITIDRFLKIYNNAYDTNMKIPPGFTEEQLLELKKPKISNHFTRMNDAPSITIVTVRR